MMRTLATIALGAAVIVMVMGASTQLVSGQGLPPTETPTETETPPPPTDTEKPGPTRPWRRRPGRGRTGRPRPARDQALAAVRRTYGSRAGFTPAWLLVLQAPLGRLTPGTAADVPPRPG
jgi:hypothetical protein